MGFIIVLILVGLVLIFAEILLIPGVGIAGALGLLSIAGSCFYAFHELGTTAGIIVTVINSALIPEKASNSTQGVNVMTLKPKYRVEKVLPLSQTHIVQTTRYRARSLPINGALLQEKDRGEEQLTML